MTSTTRVEDRRVVEVEIRLVVEEAMPVDTPSPCRPTVQFDFSVSDEDDADALVFLVRVAPDVEVALRRSGGARGAPPGTRDAGPRCG